MPRLIVTQNALAGLERCRQFLLERDEQAASRAGAAIADKLELLESRPEVGRRFSGDLHLRELVIPFGSAGYVALYRYEQEDDAVYLLAFRHQREAGY